MVISVLAVSACSDDGPTGTDSGDQLTDEEIQALFNTFATAFSSLGVAGAAAGAPPARATISISQSFDVDAPCPAGGTIDTSGSVSGSIDDETFASDLSFILTFNPMGCAVTTASGSVTIDGDPSIQLIIDSVTSEGLISLSGSQVGGIRFTSSDGRSGSCALNVDFTSSVNLMSQAVTTTTTGTVCGVNADRFSAITQG